MRTQQSSGDILLNIAGLLMAISSVAFAVYMAIYGDGSSHGLHYQDASRTLDPSVLRSSIPQLSGGPIQNIKRDRASEGAAVRCIKSSLRKAGHYRGNDVLHDVDVVDLSNLQVCLAKTHRANAHETINKQGRPGSGVEPLSDFILSICSPKRWRLETETCWTLLRSQGPSRVALE